MRPFIHCIVYNKSHCQQWFVSIFIAPTNELLWHIKVCMCMCCNLLTYLVVALCAIYGFLAPRFDQWRLRDIISVKTVLILRLHISDFIFILRRIWTSESNDGLSSLHEHGWALIVFMWTHSSTPSPSSLHVFTDSLKRQRQLWPFDAPTTVAFDAFTRNLKHVSR